MSKVRLISIAVSLVVAAAAAIISWRYLQPSHVQRSLDAQDISELNSLLGFNSSSLHPKREQVLLGLSNDGSLLYSRIQIPTVEIDPLIRSSGLGKWSEQSINVQNEVVLPIPLPIKWWDCSPYRKETYVFEERGPSPVEFKSS